GGGRSRGARPASPGGGPVHREDAPLAGGPPVDDDPAVLVLTAEVEGDPLRCRGGRAPPARGRRRFDDPGWLVTRRGARRLHARRSTQRAILESQVGERDPAAAAGSGGAG